MKTAYGLSPDELATWEYEIIDVPENCVLVKPRDHPYYGLMLIKKDKLQIQEEE